MNHKANEWKLGDRVTFVYRGEQPHTGETIHGEVVLIDPRTEMVGVLRDEKWRHADALVTWVSPADLTEEQP